MGKDKATNKKSTIKLSGKLGTYLDWPIIVAIFLVIMNIAVYIMDVNSGIVVSVCVGIYIVVLIIMQIYYKPRVLQNLVDFAGEYARIQTDLINELTLPYALLDDEGHFLWMNTSFSEVAGKEKHFHKHISTVFPEIKSIHFNENTTKYNIEVHSGDNFYRTELKQVDIHELELTSQAIEGKDDDTFIAVYLYDITELKKNIQRLKDEGFVAGLIYIDNYEETFDNVDDVRRSLFAGLIDRKINKYFTNGAGIVRKLEKDKYLAVFRYKYLEQLKNDKFSILEEVKEINIGNDMVVTVSLGLGTGGRDYAATYDLARNAIDLALGRGGDQVVIKEGDKVAYFGGKSQQVDKNTRVKARVKAHALKQIFMNKENIFIMGHKVGDVDAFGSAIGIYRAAKQLGKEAHIVINDPTTSVKPFMDKFIDNTSYGKDMFLTSEQAMDMADEDGVVVVVDVNRPTRTECPELLDICKTIVVIDHHRQTDDLIKSAVLSYVEPYASSACEMVAEILQYIDDNIKVKAIEADAMYSGIIIDTDNFNNKCAARTFEAAAYLRKCGADNTRVRKMLRNDMSDYMARAAAVSRMELYKECFAITVFDGTGIKSPTDVGAQVANELLNINGIKASFVITPYDEKMFISARSIDEVNVQVVMEKLGGGGHMSIAGAQLTDCTASQAVQTIKFTLDKMIEEGEI